MDPTTTTTLTIIATVSSLDWLEEEDEEEDICGVGMDVVVGAAVGADVGASVRRNSMLVALGVMTDDTTTSLKVSLPCAIAMATSVSAKAPLCTFACRLS